MRLLWLCIITIITCEFVLAAEVNIYSARKEDLIKPALDRFSEETGIKVNLITDKADTLIKRIELEGMNSPADVLLTVDVGRLYRAKQAGLLQPVNSGILTTRIPESYRDPDNYWFGLSLRSRVIIYAKDRVSPSELSTYEDLADPKWRKQICIRSSNNIYNQSLVAAMIAHAGIDKTEDWAQGLVENFARQPKGGDRDQIKAAAAGQCKLAIANTYYLAGMLNSKVAADAKAAEQVAVFWPDQNGYGAHMNISGAAIIKSSKNRQQAIQLLEYLTGDYAQKWYADTNHEYPIRDDIPISETLRQFGSYKADGLKLVDLGRYNVDAVKLMDRVGWK